MTTRYARGGVRLVRLTVTDADGVRSSDVVRVNVAERVRCESAVVGQRGGWREVGRAGAGRYCDNLGRTAGRDAMVLSFTGPRLSIGYATARPGGTARVFIDGDPVRSLSFDGRTTRPRFGSTRTYTGLGNGRHTMRLVMRKGAGYVDDFVIWGRPRP